MGEGREGDWECSGCRNRNYAFRSFCNRCKQPRLLVDANTPADSKWLPRIGDWICAGCSNNNYASREKCKKCGQTKEEAAMPAIAMPGISLPSYSQYLARIQGLYGSRMNFLQSGNPTFQPFQPGSNWSFWAADNYGMQPLSGKGGHSSLENTNKPPALPKTWRNGDWICDCGFHNYSSRSECKKCNAPLPSGGPSGTSTTKLNIYPTLGTKRSASQEFANEWDNKRLNAGVIASNFLSSGQQHSFHSLEQPRSSSYDQPSCVYGKIPTGNLMTASAQLSLYSSPQRAVPTLLGKGAKQWRDGDWMCNNCNNHNYASRSFCNRCKTQKEAASLPVSVA